MGIIANIIEKRNQETPYHDSPALHQELEDPYITLINSNLSKKEAKDLCRALIKADPMQAVSEIFSHSWIVSGSATRGKPVLFDTNQSGIAQSMGVEPPEMDDLPLDNMAEAYEIQEKRMNHAIKRLKDKRLYYASSDQIMACIKRSQDPGSLQMATMLISSVFYMKDDSPISEDTWKAAIEFLVFNNDPELYRSDDYVALFLEQHITELYFTVLMVHFSQMYINNVYPIVHGGASANNQQALLDEIEELKAQKSKLEKKVFELKGDLAEEKNKMADMNKQHRREMLSRDAEIRALNKLLQEEDPIEAEEPIVTTDELEEPCIETDHPFTEQELMDLPETGVMFLGGHQNIHKALINFFPDWQYIRVDDNTFTVPKACKVVFCWYNHVTHSAYQRLKKYMSKDIPLCYVTATNPDRLILEMKELYTSEQLKNAD